MRSAVLLSAVLLATTAVWADDACSQASAVADAKLDIALKDGQTSFREGEIIPLSLSFTSTVEKKYWADTRSYDRSGRLGSESYCLEPSARDPLESYFREGSFLGGGLGGYKQLGTEPYVFDAELNEWHAPAPGHYRLFVVSSRVWRTPGPNDQNQYRATELLRSNAVEFDVRTADPEWQAAQLAEAAKGLTGGTPDDSRHFARVLRFLNSRESTRFLAKLYWGGNEQPHGFDFMFGLAGSPHPAIAIDAMRAEIAEPTHAITGMFLHMLVKLEVDADPHLDLPKYDRAAPDAYQAVLRLRQDRTRELSTKHRQEMVAALPRKIGQARALTLKTLTESTGDFGDAASLRRALVAAWADLPQETQSQLVQYGWSEIAGPEMLPVLRKIAAGPPPSYRTDASMMRDAALKHIFELDPVEGRALILRDLQDARTQPGIDVVGLLTPDEVAVALEPAIARIAKNEARELDYLLLDRYSDAAVLPRVQAVFEEHLGKWACAEQSSMLRYFLRVAADYGAAQVQASLGARQTTGCYRTLLQDLGSSAAKVEKIAIQTLDDPDPQTASDAALTLGRWGSAEAESPLLNRLKKLRQDWSGREAQLRVTPDFDENSRWASFDYTLTQAIATGTGWFYGGAKLQRLLELAMTQQSRQQIQGWITVSKQAKLGPRIHSNWSPQPNFSILQYSSLSEEQLGVKLAQLPRRTKVDWFIWQPGHIFPPVPVETQHTVYERVRTAAADRGVLVEEVTEP
jgi:hypothetical protein